MKIIVLAGGNSPEREVSVRSGIASAKALCRLGHEVALIDPCACKTIETLYHTEPSDIYFETAEPQKHLDIGLMPICKTADRVFIALHGGAGEDGTVQGALDAFGISYTGSGAKACQSSMDKIKSKQIYTAVGIPTPSFNIYNTSKEAKPIAPCFPCVIKPASCGSSIGVYFAGTKKELNECFYRTRNTSNGEQRFLIERKISGREFSVSVLEDKAIAVTEIIPNGECYDYECKYTVGGAKEITPAPLSKELTEKAMQYAQKAHTALGMRNFSRTDMILENGTGRFYVLETNALPGLTETSIFPSACASVKIGFDEMCAKMLK